MPKVPNVKTLELKVDDIPLRIQLTSEKRPRLDGIHKDAIFAIVRAGGVAGFINTRTGAQIDWWIDK